jgi:hypothetical protein
LTTREGLLEIALAGSAGTTTARPIALAKRGRAVHASDGVVTVALEDGTIVQRQIGGAALTPLASKLPRSVTRLTRGPHETIAAGGIDGSVTLMHPQRSSPLVTTNLLGAIVHLAIAGSRLMAVSELGDAIEVDLSFLTKPYCELMHELWSSSQ